MENKELLKIEANKCVELMGLSHSREFIDSELVYLYADEHCAPVGMFSSLVQKISDINERHDVCIYCAIHCEIMFQRCVLLLAVPLCSDDSPYTLKQVDCSLFVAYAYVWNLSQGSSEFQHVLVHVSGDGVARFGGTCE